MADLTSLYPKQNLRDKIIQACVNKYISLAQQHPNDFLEYDFFELLDYKGGSQPPKSEFIKEPLDGYIRFLQIRDFTSDNTITYIPKTSKNKTCLKEDVLLGRYGASVGKILRGKEGAYNVACAKIIVLEEEKVSKDFLFYFFHSSLIQDTLRGITRGAQAGFNKNDISKLKILLPKWEVQISLIKVLQQIDDYLINGKKEIVFPIFKNSFLREFSISVKKLILTFKKIDFLQVGYTSGDDLVTQLRQAILQEAVQGKLSSSWRKKNNPLKKYSEFDIENFRELYQQNDSQRKGRKSFKYKESIKIDVGGRTKGVDKLLEIPISWQWVSLGQITWSINDGPHFSPSYTEKGIPIVSGRNITLAKGLNFSTAKYVSEEDYFEFIKRGKPEIGDVLLTKGGTTGVPCVVETNEEFCVWVHVALIKMIKEVVNPYYLKWVLASPFVYKQSQEQTHGIGNKDLGLTRMVYFAIPLPPLDEQKYIVKKVEVLLTLCAALEVQLKESEADAGQLMQAVLQEAFGGE